MEQNLNEILRLRRDKLANLQAAGKDPFVITKFDQTHHSMEIKANYDELEGKTVSVSSVWAIAAANAQREENTWFFSDIEAVPAKLKEMKIPGSQTAINFSSVFHEVFHYGFDLSMIKKMIASVDPQYLVVRDMMYDSLADETIISREIEARVRETLPGWQIADFEKVHGPIHLRKNLVHLLLKYKYTENWPRECAENYFSYSMEDLTAVLNNDHRYRPLLFSRYILPWIRYDLENKLGIDSGDEFTTHFSLILGKYKNGMLSLND